MKTRATKIVATIGPASNTPDILKRMIEAGVGIGVVPELVARRYAQRLKIKIVRLSDEWADRKLQICVRKLDQLPGFARDLVNMLIEDVPLADLQERE